MHKYEAALRPSAFCSLLPSSALAMAGEIVYADLNIPGGLPHPPQHTNTPQCPRWHRMALWFGWAGNIVLAGAVIALGVRGQRTTHTTERNSSLEDSQPFLKPSLPPTQNTTTEGCRCNLCPDDWQRHKNKCYWVSKDSKTWHEGRDDCSAKRSQMLVIRDKEEMAYIRSISQLNQVWLGLRLTSAETKWTWVDGSTFQETLFKLTGETDGDSCGMIKRNRTISETCTGLAKWICERAALKSSAARV